jgi:hypothetical protein
MPTGSHEIREVLHRLCEKELCLGALHWWHRGVLLLLGGNGGSMVVVVVVMTMIMIWDIAGSMTRGISFRIRIMICIRTSKIVIVI